jgi:hypothetical protein
MPELTIVQAVNLALDEEMARDDRVTLLGEDIGVNGDMINMEKNVFLIPPLTSLGSLDLASEWPFTDCFLLSKCNLRTLFGPEWTKFTQKPPNIGIVVVERSLFPL